MAARSHVCERAVETEAKVENKRVDGRIDPAMHAACERLIESSWSFGKHSRNEREERVIAAGKEYPRQAWG